MSVWAVLVVLGVIQGLTEFLPVSSDGHLALAQMLFGFQAPSLPLTVMLHAGTLAATVLYFRKQVWYLLDHSWQALRSPSRLRELPGARDALTVVIASVPTALIGLALRNTIEYWTQIPQAVGIGFLCTAAFLLSTAPPLQELLHGGGPAGGAERPVALRQANDDGAEPASQAVPWRWAILLGIAQGLAVAPGVSRSGSTIAVALWLGIRAERAFDLSMLLSVPAVAGALLLEAPRALAVALPASQLACGGIVAFAVGLVALGLLRRMVIGGRFWWFAAWVLTVAFATFALARAWPGA